jgi:hypothetical protein
MVKVNQMSYDQLLDHINSKDTNVSNASTRKAITNRIAKGKFTSDQKTALRNALDARQAGGAAQGAGQGQGAAAEGKKLEKAVEAVAEANAAADDANRVAEFINASKKAARAAIVPMNKKQHGVNVWVNEMSKGKKKIQKDAAAVVNAKRRVDALPQGQAKRVLQKEVNKDAAVVAEAAREVAQDAGVLRRIARRIADTPENRGRAQVAEIAAAGDEYLAKVSRKQRKPRQQKEHDELPEEGPGSQTAKLLKRNKPSNKLAARRASHTVPKKTTAQRREIALNTMKKIMIKNPKTGKLKKRHSYKLSGKLAGRKRQHYTRGTADGRRGSELNISEWMDMVKVRWARNKLYKAEEPLPRYSPSKNTAANASKVSVEASQKTSVGHRRKARTFYRRSPVAVGAIGKYNAMIQTFAIDAKAMEGTSYDDHKGGIKRLEKRIMRYIASDNRWKNSDFFFNPAEIDEPQLNKLTANDCKLKKIKTHGKVTEDLRAVPANLWVGYKMWRKLRAIGKGRRDGIAQFAIPSKELYDKKNKKYIPNPTYTKWKSEMDGAVEEVKLLLEPNISYDEGALWQTAMAVRADSVSAEEAVTLYYKIIRKREERKNKTVSRNNAVKEAKAEAKVARQNAQAKVDDELWKYSFNVGLGKVLQQPNNKKKARAKRELGETVLKRYVTRHANLLVAAKVAEAELENARNAYKAVRGAHGIKRDLVTAAERRVEEAIDAQNQVATKQLQLVANAQARHIDWNEVRRRGHGIEQRGRQNAKRFIGRKRHQSKVVVDHDSIANTEPTLTNVYDKPPAYEGGDAPKAFHYRPKLNLRGKLVNLRRRKLKPGQKLPADKRVPSMQARKAKLREDEARRKKQASDKYAAKKAANEAVPSKKHVKNTKANSNPLKKAELAEYDLNFY